MGADMSLTKAMNVHSRREGFWFWKKWRVYVAKSRWYTFNYRTFDALLNSEEPAELIADGRRTLWMVNGEFYWDTDHLTAEEVGLLLWDRARRHEAKLDRLRKLKVRAVDVAVSRRERIPDDVRVFVWERDEGRCVRCGAEDNLQFDHVIPVAKGGGTGVENIQLLCGDCNLLKSDSIV